MRSSGARGIYKRGTSTYRRKFYRLKTPFLRDVFFDLGQWKIKDGVRTIDKKILAFCACGLLGVGVLWWITGGGDGDTVGDRVADTHSRVVESRAGIERARAASRRTGETVVRIERSVERLDEASRRLEAGSDDVAGLAARARASVERDRASLARGRAVIDAVEKRRAARDEVGGEKKESVADGRTGRRGMGSK